MESDECHRLAVEPSGTGRSFLRRRHYGRSNNCLGPGVRRRGGHSGPLRSPTRSWWAGYHLLIPYHRPRLGFGVWFAIDFSVFFAILKIKHFHRHIFFKYPMLCSFCLARIHILTLAQYTVQKTFKFVKEKISILLFAVK